MSNRITITDLYKKKEKSKIVMLTCYTAPIAKILDNHVDILLVGDSLGMTVYGHNNTLAVTKRMMIDHGKCVVDNSKNALVVIDLPFGSYETDKIRAFDTAAEIISKTNAAAVKLEGGKEISETVEFIVSRGIPVMGHIGLLPQSINATSGYRVQGKDELSANEIIVEVQTNVKLLTRCTPIITISGLLGSYSLDNNALTVSEYDSIGSISGSAEWTQATEGTRIAPAIRAANCSISLG